MIEVIEHIPDKDVNSNLLERIFTMFSPTMMVISTPNVDFNTWSY
jgi:2-polyprenyl-3-methyl-5-hydroxy-6-metoxy-1,4-benzoquinol methylase